MAVVAVAVELEEARAAEEMLVVAEVPVAVLVPIRTVEVVTAADLDLETELALPVVAVAADPPVEIAPLLLLRRALLSLLLAMRLLSARLWIKNMDSLPFPCT